VVDQFEEVFSTADAAEQEAFINCLVALANDPNVVVLITIRADFTGHCAPYPELAGLRAANLVLVAPMTADQLRRVIEAPARRDGLRVESSMVDDLVGEVVDDPGGLPLLSTALVQLWQARDGGWLRLNAHQEIGGVRTAVARLAEASYRQLPEPERQMAMTVLLRLVVQGEGDGTAALLDLRTLHLYASLPATKGLEALALAFTSDGRLLVTGDQGGNVNSGMYGPVPRSGG
jgi:hypothetical protein